MVSKVLRISCIGLSTVVGTGFGWNSLACTMSMRLDVVRATMTRVFILVVFQRKLAKLSGRPDAAMRSRMCPARTLAQGDAGPGSAAAYRAIGAPL